MRGRAEDAALIAPGLLLLLLAFFLPIAEVLVLSVRAPGAAGGPSLAQFGRFLGDSYYLGLAWRTLRLSAVITLVCLALGFPLAYVMARAAPRLRLWLVVLTILPLMTSVVVRTFGWVVVLGRGGLVPRALEALGLASQGVSLMHTETAIVIGMAQVLLPFMTLSILGVQMRIDPRLEEAARTMGCGFWRAVAMVVVPASRPGIVSGSLLVFTLSISAFITPSLLGGARLPVLAGSIYDTATRTLDWPFAAAQSAILLFAVLLVLFPYVAATRRRRG
ncbi:MAG: ABC transporter permease [Rhodospirillaceae bacterium]|nr:ABC transporter permease [Rhodospirillaceae bacterium]